MKENSVFFFNSSVIVSVTVIIGDGDGGPNFDLRGCSCTGDFSPETLIQTRSFKTKRKVPPTTIQISILFLYWRRLRPQSNFSNVIQTRKKRCTSVCPTARAPKIPKSRVGKIPTLFLQGLQFFRQKRKMLWTLQIYLFCCKNGAQYVKQSNF